MAVLNPVRDGSFTGVAINSTFNGVADGEILLNEVTRDYDNFREIRARFSPNHLLYEELQGGCYAYRAALIYTNSDKIPIPAGNKKIQKINSNIIKSAMISQKAELVDNQKIIFNVQLKADLVKIAKKANNYNSLFIVLIPFQKIEY